MTKELLEAVAGRMAEYGLPYQYEIYSTDGKLPELYFVGHCSSSPVTTEDGRMSGTFLLTGIGTRWSTLEDAHAKIRDAFPRVSGFYQTKNGVYAIAIHYQSALAVPMDDAKIKKLQINLSYQEWSVM